jgi:hypothetical protein
MLSDGPLLSPFLLSLSAVPSADDTPAFLVCQSTKPVERLTVAGDGPERLCCLNSELGMGRAGVA